jgi:hypothetical protein
MPDWVADKQRRLEKIREAKAELEAEAKAAAEETRRREEAEKKRIAEGRKKNGKAPTPPKQEPEGKTQRNFTDHESRVLLTKDGYIQGYNAQAAVDAEAQIIVAHGLTQSMSDQDQLVALVDGIKNNLGRKPKEASADTAARPTSAPWPIAGSALTSQLVGPSTPPRPNESAAARSPRPCGTS